MAIPRYDSPQVQNAPVEAARLHPGMAPNLAGAVGAGLSQGVAGFEQIRQQVKGARLEDAWNPLRVKGQQIALSMTQMKGKQVTDPEAYGGDPGMSLTETALADFDKAAAAQADTLAPPLREEFMRGAQRFRIELEHQVSNHETVQLNSMFQQIYKDTDATEADHVSKVGVVNGLPDGPTIQQSLERRIANAQAWAQSQGVDAAPAIAAAKADTYRTVIAGLLAANNAAGAQAYFSDHKDDLDEKTRLHVGQIISQHVLANDVQTKADEIAALGLPLDQQDAKAREAFKGNVEGQKALQAELEHRFSVQKTAQTAATQDVTGKLWDMRFPTMPGQQAKSLPDIMRTTEWAALNGTQRNELRAQWESYSKRNQNDPATLVAQFATYQKFLDDPKSLINLTDGQISSFMGSLGPDLTMRLMEAKRKAAGNLESLRANTLNDIPFKDIAGEYGLKIKGNLGQQDLANLGLLRDKTLEAIRDEQQVIGKPVTPERKEQILRGLLVNGTTKRGWYNPMGWFGDDYTQGGKPLFQMKDFTELEATDEEKTLAVGYLVQAGSPITPVNVQTMLNAIRAKKAGK